MAAELSAFRGAILSFKDDPGVTSPCDSHVHFEDGLLVVEDGRVARVGPAEALLPTLPRGTPVTDHRGRLLMPGFVDAHVHYAQTDVIASGLESGGAAPLTPGDSGGDEEHRSNFPKRVLDVMV